MSQEMEKLHGVVMFVSSIAFVLLNCNVSRKRNTRAERTQGSITLTTSCSRDHLISQDIQSNNPKLKDGNEDKRDHNTRTTSILSGKGAVRTLLSGALCSTSPLSDPVMFYNWVMNTIQVKSQSSCSNEFQKRQSLLEIKCLHEKEILQTEECEADALRVWHEHPMYTEHLTISQRSEVITKAVANMEAQFERKLSAAKLESLQKVFQEKQLLQLEIEKQLYPLKTIAEYQAYVVAADKHSQLLVDLGISTTEKELATMQHSTGVRKSKGGFRFEDEAAKVIHDQLLANIAEQHQVPIESLIIVRNITFQMASFEGSPGEIDMMVCRRIRNSNRSEDITVLSESVTGKEEQQKKNLTTTATATATATATSISTAVKNRRNNDKEKKKQMNVDVMVLAVIEVRNSVLRYNSCK